MADQEGKDFSEDIAEQNFAEQNGDAENAGAGGGGDAADNSQESQEDRYIHPPFSFPPLLPLVHFVDCFGIANFSEIVLSDDRAESIDDDDDDDCFSRRVVRAASLTQNGEGVRRVAA